MRYLLYALPLVIFLGAGIAFWWALDTGRDPSRLPSALIDKPAPQFELPAVEGLAMPGLSTADLAGSGAESGAESGTVTLVNFFASWCVPCKAEHPILVRLAAREGVRLVGVNYKDKPEDAVRFLEEMGNPYARVGADPQGRASLDWGLTGVPETFVIGPEGTIRYRHPGPINPPDVESLILPAIAEARR
jgi:cytochrome c biogenesis protein CcmG/thiol:disulfide interchange protein DsbE